MKRMRSWERYFSDRMGELEKCDAVYDIGGGAQPQERARFKKYVLVDVNAAYKPDVVADIQTLPFADGSLEAVYCAEVLEHVKDPRKAASELKRVLKPGGKLLLTVPFIWPYHAAPPLYLDYWRFTADGLRELFGGFSSLELVKKGGWFSALVNFIPSYTYIDRLFRPLAAWLDDLPFKIGKTTAPGHILFAVR